MPTKRPVKVFSGRPTSDLSALNAAISQATMVRLHRGGCLIYAVRAEDDVLAPETEKWIDILSDEPVATCDAPEQIRDLRAALEVAELQDFVCMCPGDLALEFVDEEHRQVEVVRFDFPDALDWHGWEGKAVLADSSHLLAWLNDHGIARSR